MTVSSEFKAALEISLDITWVHAQELFPTLSRSNFDKLKSEFRKAQREGCKKDNSKNKRKNKKRKKNSTGKKNPKSNKITVEKLKGMSIKSKLKLVGETAVDKYLLTGIAPRILVKAIDILMKPEFIELGEIIHGIPWTSDTPPYKRPEFMYDHQLIAMKLMETAHILWQASRQLGGKTTATILKDFEDMLGNDGYTVALVAPSVTLAAELLAKFLHSTIRYQGKKYNFYEIIKPYLLKDPNYLGFTLKNGSRLMILSLKQSSSQGRTIDVVHIEELDKLTSETSKRQALAGIINSVRANPDAKIRCCCNVLNGIFRLLKTELFNYGHYFNIFVEDVFNPEDDYNGRHTIINEDVIVVKKPKLDEILSIFSEVLVSESFALGQLYNVDDTTDDVFNPDKMEIAYNHPLNPSPMYVKTSMGIDPGGKVDAFGVSVWSLTKQGKTELRWCKRFFNATHTAKAQAKELAHIYIDYNVDGCQPESSAGSPWSMSLIEHYVNKYSDGNIIFRYEYVNFEGEGKLFDKNNFVYLFKILLDYQVIILHRRNKEEKALHRQLSLYIINKSESNNNPDDLAESAFHGVWKLLGGFDYIEKLIDRRDTPVGVTM
ncbi:hypothetical protein LCGC14_0708730 [marine sediment metagenome]|uniref:Uncharacterized protein n=1 Tax=marine sediment metagenome TaxID=412755 RepID=A0A0F9QKC9_9ZZZZ